MSKLILITVKPPNVPKVTKLKEKKLNKKGLLIEMEFAMQDAAEKLEFERAIELREEIRKLKQS